MEQTYLPKTVREKIILEEFSEKICQLFEKNREKSPEELPGIFLDFLEGATSFYRAKYDLNRGIISLAPQTFMEDLSYTCERDFVEFCSNNIQEITKETVRDCEESGTFSVEISSVFLRPL